MEIAPAAAGPGTVVLDIGGDIGAAVVVGDSRLTGRELEIRAAGEPWAGRHVAFHRRATAAGTTTAAVYPQLAAGDWEVRLMDVDGQTVALSVTGGRVSTIEFHLNHP